jgi:thioredoxin 1
MAGQLRDLSDADFDAKVLASERPYIVDFWAPWCGPCKMVTPILEELAGELAGKVEIGKMDIAQHPQTAAKYGIQSIPALLIFKSGKVADMIVGAQPKNKLRDKIAKALG